ncbi:MAG: TusE/DsrC/DsvC family sulfur relay protein [Buchnera aphidicola (Periphyllus lyropictus)]|uniref:TusE/DsrC/DsvC family sulfur relay protein n=1 Tax=Buchnera aphidicola TaxID=9 RepID=UPI001EC98C19|nr:TusE/DsrC/DsvC family sulfur relay protein [Buchnera aphidicola]NIH16524.1 TusE/DsrC/DsvC family sulfur relay protein [Buchnera aphidicola (Periphyllus lyropictus)]USS94807.1 TusE/DsrC/DsvC family sulfur relay protein [Buchnera aphidicola (Periphyllus lyropictus)]
MKKIFWNKKYALKIAKKEKIKIKKIHWKIIFFTRNFYLKFHIIPSIRILLTAINKTYKKKLNSVDLINLFPKNPAIKISKIAGIPNPKKCI